MFNFRDSHTTLERSKDVLTGSTVTVEGAVLVGGYEAGVEKVKLASATVGEPVLGFSKLDNESFTRDARVETIVVPAVLAGHTYAEYQLTHGLINGTAPYTYSIRAYDNTDAVACAQSGDGSPATHEFLVNNATSGLLYFNSADVGNSITFYYDFTLTAVEATQLMPGVRTINNAAAAQLNAVTVMGGTGEVYTKEYDVTADFSACVAPWATGAHLTTMAGGKITVVTATETEDGSSMYAAASGVDLTNMGWRVNKLPDTTDAHLGLRITTSL